MTQGPAGRAFMRSIDRERPGKSDAKTKKNQKRPRLLPPMAMTRMFCLVCLTLLAVTLSCTGAALGQEEPDAPETRVESDESNESGASAAFDEDLALGVYGTAWAGAYPGVGGGGRLRWEPFDMLGLDLFAESLIVDNPGGGLRHDHSIGFNLYIPIELTPSFRIRPLFGFCAVFSMIEPAQDGAPRADDVLFGIHGGAGVEWSPQRYFSVFLDVQATGYLGHDRSSHGWTGEVSEEYGTFAVVQASLGAQVHFSL